MTLEEIRDELVSLSDPRGDVEYNHLRADYLLCEALRLHGEQPIVDLFARIEKWYA